MRILLASFFFPPHNNIGAVRAGKTAKYLCALGHDVRVLTASNQPTPLGLPLEVPADIVTRTPWFDVNAPVRWASGGRAKTAARGFGANIAGNGLFQRLLRSAGRWYKSAVNVPDGMIGWYPYAVSAGRRLTRGWRPDLIYGSAMPATALLVARKLAREFEVPWVAEFRDLWVDNHGYAHGPMRRVWERHWERRVLSDAAGLVTVGESLAERLQARYRLPTAVIYNGFDPGDIPASPSRDRDSPACLRIVYTGMVYEGRQDPGPLFEALRILEVEAGNIRVEFCGRYLESVRLQARRFDVEHLIDVSETIPYAESLRRQRDADLLLFLTFNDPEQPGVYTGKLFEYLGARRPILAVGAVENAATDLIRRRNAGAVVSRPREIAEILRQRLREKAESGRIADLPESVGDGFTRREQTTRLGEFLSALVKRSA